MRWSSLVGVAFFLAGCFGGGRVGRGDDRAALTTTTTVTPPATTRCGRSMTGAVTDTGGDFDGDGRLDTAYHREGVDDPDLWVIGVCLATGSSDEVEVGSFEGVFYAHDLDVDGRAELIYGGTSASQQLDLVAEFVDGRLRTFEDAGPLLASGLLGSDASGQGWGCDDIDGDGRREVIQVTVRREGATAQWTKEAYRISGAAMPLVRTETGRAPSVGYAWDQAQSLVGPC